jgi:ankyrin repeat protein
MKRFNDAVIADNYDDLLEIFRDPNFDVNSPMYSHCSALAYAVVNNKPELVGVFLQMKANPNSRMADDMPILQYAVERGFHEVVEKLLADPRTKDYLREESGSALHIAAANGDRRMVDMLLQKGADPIPSAPYVTCEAPYKLAKANNHHDLAVHLQKQSLSLKNAFREKFPLISRHEMEELSDKEQHLQAKVTELGHIPSKSIYPLMGTSPALCNEGIVKAVNEKDVKALLDLLAEGAIYDHNRSEDFIATIEKACINGPLMMVKVLIELGSDYSDKGLHGSASEIANKNGHKDIVDYLKSVKEEQLAVFEQFVELKRNIAKPGQ